MPIEELYETEPDDLDRAMEDLRHVLVRAEDKLATAFVYPASLALYNYETRGGTIKQRTYTHNGRVTKTPVAHVSFDGESLKLERFWYQVDEQKKGKYTGKVMMWHPDKPKVDDVLALEVEDSFWACEVVRLLPEMHERLIEDAKVDPEEIRATTQRLNAWLRTIHDETTFGKKTDG